VAVDDAHADRVNAISIVAAQFRPITVIGLS
jgi:hypothetical protein